MIRTLIAIVTLGMLVGAAVPLDAPAQQMTKVKLGTCARTLTAGVGGPFAVAIKLGWFRDEGLDVDVVPLPGSTDCVKNVATREMPFSLPSVEPLTIGRAQGIKAKIYYTAYQNSSYGIAVPDDSPIRKISDLRGKRIGVTNMSSAGVIIARALAAENGLNPDTDINIVVAGEGAQPAALIRSKQIDALSQFDTQYALIEIAGIKLRRIEAKTIERFPANGFLALEETIKNRRKEAIGLARAYAKATIFAITNPEATVRILYDVFPQTKPTGKEEAVAIADDVKVLQARLPAFRLEAAGVKRWGENSEKNYGAYVEFLLKYGVIKDKVDVKDLVTNELIDEINRFDAKQVAAQAKAYRVR
jgi:NitT/TauT family transport system substrate-binding protein